MSLIPENPFLCAAEQFVDAALTRFASVSTDLAHHSNGSTSITVGTTLTPPPCFAGNCLTTFRFNGGELEMLQCQRELAQNYEDDDVIEDPPVWLDSPPALYMNRSWTMKPTRAGAADVALEVAERSFESVNDQVTVQVEEILRRGNWPGPSEDAITSLLRVQVEESYLLATVHAIDWAAMAERTHALSVELAHVVTGKVPERGPALL